MMMLRSPLWRASVLSGLLALLAASIPAAAQESPATGICTLPESERPDELVEPVEACGVTTIAGSQSTSVDVHLPRDVTVATPFGSSPDLDVEGTGRFVGFVLTGTEPGTAGLTLVGGRFPAHASPVEFIMPVPPYPATGGGSFEVLKLYGDEVTLPAGDYRLYLLTDGGEVEVTLRLDELDGWVDLAPERPADYRLFFPESRLLAGAGATSNVYSAGRSGSLATTGLVFQALWLDTDAHAAGQYVFCHAAAGDPDVDPIELGPGCPAFSQKFELANNRSPTAEPDTKLYLQALDQLSPGRRHFGFWSSTEAVVTDLRYAQFWLAYGDPPPVTENPHISDGCGDADRMVQVGGTVVPTPDPERAAGFDIDAVWFEDLYDEEGTHAGVRVHLRMCGDLPEPELLGSAWSVSWSPPGGCSRDLYLYDRDNPNPTLGEVRTAYIYSQCSQPGPIPGSSESYLEWATPLDEDTYSVDGNLISWTLTPEMVPPEDAWRLAFLAPGTRWSRPIGYARDGRQLILADSDGLFVSGPGAGDHAGNGRDFVVGEGDG